METPLNSIETLLERAEAYGKTSLELSKLKTLKAVTAVVTSLTTKMVVLISISLSVIIGSIGLSIWIGELAGQVYLGFFIVALLYLILGVILHFFFYGWVRKPLSNLIISEALENT